MGQLSGPSTAAPPHTAPNTPHITLPYTTTPDSFHAHRPTPPTTNRDKTERAPPHHPTKRPPHPSMYEESTLLPTPNAVRPRTPVAYDECLSCSFQPSALLESLAAEESASHFAHPPPLNLLAQTLHYPRLCEIALHPLNPLVTDSLSNYLQLTH